MFPAWVPYQPVNFSQDVSVMHKWTRCQPSPTASLHPTGGAGKGWARPWLPSHPSARAAPSLFRRKKPREAKGGCNKTFPGQFLPSFLLPPSPCWDGQEWEQDKSCGWRRGASRQGRGLLPTARRPCHQHILKPQVAPPCVVEGGHGPHRG